MTIRFKFFNGETAKFSGPFTMDFEASGYVVVRNTHDGKSWTFCTEGSEGILSFHVSETANG